MAVRVCRGVRGLETNFRAGFEGRVGDEGVFERWDAGCGWRAECWRRR